MSQKSAINTHLLKIELSGLNDGFNFIKKFILRSFSKGLSLPPNNKLLIDNIRGFRSSTLHVSGEKNSIQIKGRLEGCSILIEGNDNEVHIDTECHFRFTEFTIIANNSWIRIGKSGTANGKPHLPNLFLVRGSSNGIDVDDDTMLAYGIEVRTTDSHKIFDLNGAVINLEKSIRIGRHVWLGARTTILKGSDIAPDSVIAAGAIVSGKIPANVIAGGIPAKTIRQGINWRR